MRPRKPATCASAKCPADFRIGTIGGANVANVVLEASRQTSVNAGAGSYVQGQRVELLSTAGGIGAVGDPLRVRTAYSSSILDWPSYGLKAKARDSITIRNEQDVANAATYSGNLLLISAESLLLQQRAHRNQRQRHR